MLNAAYIVSYSSGKSHTFLLLLFWNVSSINLALRANSLLMPSECSIHMTAPPAATLTSIKKSSDSKFSLEELWLGSGFP